jgi:hypothetical protein
MKLAALAVLVLFAAPAFAQQSQSAVDWSKPVIGVDRGVASRPKDEVKPVSLYTLQDRNGLSLKPPAPVPDHLIASAPESARDTAPSPSCELPVVK